MRFASLCSLRNGSGEQDPNRYQNLLTLPSLQLWGRRADTAITSWEVMRLISVAAPPPRSPRGAAGPQRTKSARGRLWIMKVQTFSMLGCEVDNALHRQALKPLDESRRSLAPMALRMVLRTSPRGALMQASPHHHSTRWVSCRVWRVPTCVDRGHGVEGGSGRERQTRGEACRAEGVLTHPSHPHKLASRFCPA